MGEWRWTEATADLVAEAHHEWNLCGCPPDRRLVHRPFAERILGALAEAGQLCPPGMEISIQEGHWSPSRSYVYDCPGPHGGPGHCEFAVSHRSYVTRWPDGSRHEGPWVEVPADA